MKRLKVLFVSGTPLGTATCRYRCDHPAEALRAAGAQADVVYIGQPRVRVAHDIVVLYRICATAEGKRFAKAARACGATLVYSTDDVVFDVENAPPQMGKRFRALAPLHRLMLSEADAALASTDFLADLMRAAVPGTPVYTVRNFLGTELGLRSEAAYRLRVRKSVTPRITLGYLSGSPTHDDDLATIAELLRRVLEANEVSELLLVGPVRLPEILREREAAGQVRHLPSVAWERLPALMAEQEVSINLAPLDLSQGFCHAKSEVKYLEAAALCIPTVASASRGFREAIPSHDGNEGCYLAETAADWMQHLNFLIQHKAECEDKGRRAYQFAHSPAMAAANQAAVRETFETLMDLPNPGHASPGSEKVVNWPFSPRYALKSALEHSARLRTTLASRSGKR